MDVDEPPELPARDHEPVEGVHVGADGVEVGVGRAQCPDGVADREDFSFDIGLHTAVPGIEGVPPFPLGDLP